MKPLLLIVLIAIAVFVAAQNRPEPETTESDIRALVTSFGSELKNVSLLAPGEDLRAQMDAHYAEYVAPALLDEWKENPDRALGRSVSSPWPERIEITSIIESDGKYTVEGNVIEISSTESPTDPAALYPVTLVVERSATEWRITSAEKGPYQEMPKRIAVSGTWECLPHRDTSGPQTMECAFGIKQDGTGSYYALDLGPLSVTPIDFPSGARVNVEGAVIPQNETNRNTWNKYMIVGMIGVTSIQEN